MNCKTLIFRSILMLLTIFTLNACSKKAYVGVNQDKKIKVTKDAGNKVKVGTSKQPTVDPIVEAENNTTDAGKAVLEVGRKMVFEEKAIIKGACWDYINEVFNRAGYGTNKKAIFKSKKSGPYADINIIKPGDWLYYINYSYGGIEHSGIFVYWKDFENKIGVTLSYGGEKRNEPGRYLEYDLKSVYYITRPGE
ncbi:MAG: hypothetical protein U0W24_22495 [Bacteroidales bacterium]